ncbi:unnamed protein product, partial [marine sediment metagenome]
MEPTPSSNQIAAAEKEFCDAFRRDHPFWWLITLFVPPVSAVAFCLVLGFTGGAAQLHKVLLTAAATFFFLGKFVILHSAPLKLFALVV